MLDDLAAGVLLSYFCYWQRPDKQGKSRLRVEKDGYRWIAKSREEGMAETGLNLSKYKRSMELLVAMELLITRVYRFNGVTTTHARVNEEKVWAMLDSWRTMSQPVVSPCATPVGSLCAIHLAHCEPTLTKTTAETTTETTEHAGKPANPGQAMSELDKLMEKVQGHQPKTLSGLWRKRMAVLFDGYQKPLTKKDEGQLKLLQKALLAAKQDPMAAVDYALQNWPTFTLEVKADKGLTSGLPQTPSIGFTLMYHDVLVQLIAAKPVKPNLKIVEVSAPPKPPQPDKPAFVPDISAALALFKPKDPQ